MLEINLKLSKSIINIIVPLFLRKKFHLIKPYIMQQAAETGPRGESRLPFIGIQVIQVFFVVGANAY